MNVAHFYTKSFKFYGKSLAIPLLLFNRLFFFFFDKFTLPTSREGLKEITKFFAIINLRKNSNKVWNICFNIFYFFIFCCYIFQVYPPKSLAIGICIHIYLDCRSVKYAHLYLKRKFELLVLAWLWIVNLLLFL